jgi:hypothetical protein
MQSRELSNGFANRFLIFWAERERIEAFPTVTHSAIVNDLAERTREVIRFALGNYPDTADSVAMELSPEARGEYGRLYTGELSETLDGEKVTSLLERRAPMLLRIAMLFALTDLVLVIEVRHLRAALAWTRFHRDSVRFIFSDAAGEDAARESSDAARKIVVYLSKHGRVSRSDLHRKCFSGHLASARIDEALDSLLMDTPPTIDVVQGVQGENGKRQKSYGLITPCVLGVPGVVAHYGGVSPNTRTCVSGLLGSDKGKPNTPITRTAQTEKTPETGMNRPTALNTPNNHSLMQR